MKIHGDRINAEIYEKAPRLGSGPRDQLQLELESH